MRKITIIVLALGIFALSSCEKDPPIKEPDITSPTSQAEPGKWRRMFNINNTEIIAPVYFSIGNKGYTINQQTLEVYEYDAVSNKLTKKNNFTGSRRESLATAFSIGNKGYYGLGRGLKSIKAGSQTDWSYVFHTDFWEYDPTTDNWTRKKDLPVPVNPFQPDSLTAYYGAYGIAINGKGYVGSGRDFNEAIRKELLWEYDPQTNSWANKTGNYAPGYAEIVMAFSIDNKGYIGDTTRLWEFNPIAANPWKELNASPATVKEPVISLSSRTKGYIYGSVTSLNNMQPQLKNDFWEFTPDAGKGAWRQLLDFAGKPRAASPAFFLNNKIYIGFGSDLFASVLGDMWEYTPTP